MPPTPSKPLPVDVCPLCRDSSIIRVTRIRVSDGAKVRRRECNACGHRWSTAEVLPGTEPPEVTHLKRTMRIIGRDLLKRGGGKDA
jgi:transcriptional regulator NrdR family protein